MAFLKEFLENFNFEKNQQTTKYLEKLPSMLRVNLVILSVPYKSIKDQTAAGVHIAPIKASFQRKIFILYRKNCSLQHFKLK